MRYDRRLRDKAADEVSKEAAAFDADDMAGRACFGFELSPIK